MAIEYTRIHASCSQMSSCLKSRKSSVLIELYYTWKANFCNLRYTKSRDKHNNELSWASNLSPPTRFLMRGQVIEELRMMPKKTSSLYSFTFRLS